jgi:sigma-B regulation protein RsbU (phosphoserine phosphatase)
MGIFTLVLIILWVFNTVWVTPRMRSNLPGLAFFLNIVTPLLLIPAIYYLWKLTALARRKLLWRISRRLILAHIFIGAIPVVIIVGIFYISALLFYYQISYYLISNQIGMHATQIHAFNLSLQEGLQSLTMESGGAPAPNAIKEELDSDAKYLLSDYPMASIILSYPDPMSGRIVAYANQNSNSGPLEDYEVPAWLGEREFSGLVLEDTKAEIHGSRLFLKSFISSDFQPDFPFSLEVSVPFNHYMLGRLKAVLGQDFLLAKHIESSGMNVMLQETDIRPENILESTFELEGSKIVTSSLWAIYLFPTSWETGLDADSDDSDILLIELSIPKLMQNLYRHESVIGQKILGVLQTIVIFFLLVEITSIVIGIVLTKSITNAVHSLDRGTEFVKRGDFSHRIIVRSRDQLGALAASFNQMTEYVRQLVRERVQKERLERELEIAKEVQEQLFPSRAPQMDRIEVAGVCLPARVVSGDYYDFLPLGMNELGLAMGDICGKGISAALLMANLQATLRSNVINLWQRNRENGNRMVSEVVERLNAQIYSFTTANKFASFFFAFYDGAEQTMTYCNAGHNPPLYFTGNEVRRLTEGGTIVGIFPDIHYGQETIQLSAGDLFVAYTDGIVESINEYGEEYGENRLVQLIQQNRGLPAEGIKEIIIKSVLDWAFAEERDDDMTLIIAKMIKQEQAGIDHKDQPLNSGRAHRPQGNA